MNSDLNKQAQALEVIFSRKTKSYHLQTCFNNILRIYLNEKWISIIYGVKCSNAFTIRKSVLLDYCPIPNNSCLHLLTFWLFVTPPFLFGPSPCLLIFGFFARPLFLIWTSLINFPGFLLQIFQRLKMDCSFCEAVSSLV